MIDSTASMTAIRNEYADTAEPWQSVEQCQMPAVYSGVRNPDHAAVGGVGLAISTR